MKEDYIPSTLEEAITFIISVMSEEDKDWAKTITEKEFQGHLHHSYGMSLRNGWGLWKGSNLKDWFQNNLEIFHADDMTGIIFHCVWRQLNNKPEDINTEVETYHKHWDKYGLDKQGNKKGN